jgi:hypothetical protein
MRGNAGGGGGGGGESARAEGSKRPEAWLGSSGHASEDTSAKAGIFYILFSVIFQNHTADIGKIASNHLCLPPQLLQGLLTCQFGLGHLFLKNSMVCTVFFLATNSG